MAAPVSLSACFGKSHRRRPFLRFRGLPYLIAEPQDELRMDFAPNAVAAVVEPTFEFLFDEQGLCVLEVRDEIDLARLFRQSIDAVNVGPSFSLRISVPVTVQPFQLGNPPSSIAPPGHWTMPDDDEFRPGLDNRTVQQPCQSRIDK